jgi:hypothetical protein
MLLDSQMGLWYTASEPCNYSLIGQIAIRTDREALTRYASITHLN